MKEVTRTQFGNAQHQSGELAAAKQAFQEAESLQKQSQSEYCYLYSLRGFRFCELLLSFGQYKEVQERANQTLQWEMGRLLDIALDELSLGRVFLIQASLEEAGDPSTALRTSLTKAADFLNQAVDGLREAGTQHHIPKGLLARAELFRYQQSWNKAWADLQEAKEITERGEMNLYMADYHLEAARVCLSQGGRLEEARQHCEEAAKRVNDMGYHRRAPEVLLIQAEIEINEGNKKQAKETLKTAERRINEMGCHRWDREVERLKELLDRRRHSTY